MNDTGDFEGLEVGFDIPARPGMAAADIQTPCLVVDLDALERNLTRMRDFVQARGMRLRAHAKMHRSVDVARLQLAMGGAVGICCQKVAEAEVFARAGIADILVTNQVRDPVKIDRLARLPRFGGAVSVCVDDIANVAELAEAVARNGTELGVLVEIDCGASRCGVRTPEAAVEIARAVAAAEGLRFEGIQAYQGAMQHIEDHAERAAAFAAALAVVRPVVDALTAVGLKPRLVTGAGTGSFRLETESGVYNELQCGSYAFMDADYGRIRTANGARLDEAEWENALFLLTQVMSQPVPGRAVCDAGLKSQSMDSGLPLVFGRTDLAYVQCSDEHGTISDPEGSLAIGEKLRLVPGHCDPTVNLHDWLVGVRGKVVESLWPVSARGRSY
ncbi:DSD1 family PLP-dependent enzyme [Seohaeicola nanhaiensis]|uniref:DSD1 family PLP-dependent enzyme n=1 Tax=Seohaeicola nanhaiensis TaxID=1387282 RepID=A0ABV9KGG0_9RHOB